ncbi:MAG: AAA family ATPase [Burkholderiaceae bacterium]|nr:AAA family ATPase [Burkholderiaceae bacterium]
MSPPSLEGLIERERLVNALAMLPAAAKWLQAPSGTGKSTLAASYARSRNKRLVWYRLDERDNDPAFFYDSFVRAIATQSRATESLPRFSGDDHEHQQQFAERFTTALDAQLASHPTLFVLDDVQRVTDDAMQSALAALVSIAGDGNEMLFVSESTAPATFFDSIAARRLALLNDADLHFDADECRAMTAALRVGSAQCDSIAALTGGHAGALVLACELLRGTDPKSALGTATVERIHSHLLAKLVERMPEERRQLLLQTAFVTQLTRPIAQALAGADASKELDALVDSGLLRRVRIAEIEIFEAHGLVRQGMQSLVRARGGDVAERTLAERTAGVLALNDQSEAALSILVNVGSMDRAIEQLQSLAERYAALGHVDLLLSWIARLPEADARRNAWLCFWTGQTLLRVNEEHARVWFGLAYSAFATDRDESGMRLAAASNVIALTLEWADLQQLDLWIERHSAVDGERAIALTDQFEPVLLMGLICVALVRGSYPAQFDSEAAIARMRTLLASPSLWISDDQRLQAATILIKHGHAFVEYELARNVIIATRSLPQSRAGGALHRGRWFIAAADTQLVCGDPIHARADLNEAQLLAEQSQSPRLWFEFGFASADHFMKGHDLQLAAKELQRLEGIATTAPPTQRAEYSRMRARLLLLSGQLADGLHWALEAIRMAEPAGLTGASMRMFEIELIYALTANDQLAAALQIVRQREYEPREVRLSIEYSLQFLLSGGTDIESLRIALLNARQIGFINLMDRARSSLAQICEAALANQLESDFVLRIIETKRLAPPPLAGPHWPWPVHVKTLGGFQLEVQGQRYRPSHKAQDKPLELLKLLLTCQALGRDSAEKNWIAERMWPDAEVDNARKSLDMTVGRLRRLLARDDAILTYEGRLQLSSDVVWTDIRLLLLAISHAQLRRDRSITGRSGSNKEAAASIAAVLQNYTGAFLADEEGPAWLLAGREAVAAKVRHALLVADAMLDGDTALIPALEKAFSADPTSEDLAQALMRTYLRVGQNSEAVRVYRRLREMLSLLLGIAPSAESDDIRSRAYESESKKSLLT